MGILKFELPNEWVCFIMTKLAKEQKNKIYNNRIEGQAVASLVKNMN